MYGKNKEETYAAQIIRSLRVKRKIKMMVNHFVFVVNELYKIRKQKSNI